MSEWIENDLRERIADAQHEIWAHWMRYMLSIRELNEDGSATIPRSFVDRWKRQAKTTYRDLTEQEKRSDREQADKVIRVLGPKAHGHDGVMRSCFAYATVSARDVDPSGQRYCVVIPHDHEALNVGDIVIMQDIHGEKLLIRCADYTAHYPVDKIGQYVHLMVWGEKPCSGDRAEASIPASDVAPGDQQYRVTFAPFHKTLRMGDIVVMRESPWHHNFLVRVSDATIHDVMDGNEQHVHLLPLRGAQ